MRKINFNAARKTEFCENCFRGLAALPPRGGPWKLESGSGQNSRLIQRRELGGGLKLLGLRKFP